MKIIRFRYFVTVTDWSKRIEEAKKEFQKSYDACKAFAESLGAASMVGDSTSTHFYPRKLLFTERFQEGQIPSWLCGESLWNSGWAYAPRRSTKKGKEVYQKLEQLKHLHLDGLLLRSLGLLFYEAVGMFGGYPIWKHPAVIHNSKENRLYVELPCYADEQGYPPQLVEGLEEIEHWQFVKGVEV